VSPACVALSHTDALTLTEGPSFTADYPLGWADTCNMQIVVLSHTPHMAPLVIGTTHTQNQHISPSPSLPISFHIGHQEEQRREREKEKGEEEEKRREMGGGAAPRRSFIEQHSSDELHHDVLSELEEELHKPSSSSSYGGPQSSIYLHAAALAELLHLKLPQGMVRTPRHPSSSFQTLASFPLSSMTSHGGIHHFWWTTFPQHMHGASITCRSFPTSL